MSKSLKEQVGRIRHYIATDAKFKEKRAEFDRREISEPDLIKYVKIHIGDTSDGHRKNEKLMQVLVFETPHSKVTIDKAIDMAIRFNEGHPPSDAEFFNDTKQFLVNHYGAPEKLFKPDMKTGEAFAAETTEPPK
jgi:hypothetical protein